MKFLNIQQLKDCILQKISVGMPDVCVADEFCSRSLYLPLDKDLIVVSLKSAAQKGVALGRQSYENAMPAYGSIADITIGFKLFCGSDTSSLSELSTRLASCILFDNGFDTQSFSCGKVSYNQEFEVMEQECEGHFSLILIKEAT